MNQNRLKTVRGLGGMLALLLAGSASIAHAQMLDYEGVDDVPDAEVADDTGVPADSVRQASDRGGRKEPKRPRVTIQPYVEAQQIVTTRLKGNDDSSVYTQIGAGVNAGIATRRAEGQLGLRYGYRFGWGNEGDQSDLSGIGRVRYDLVPRSVTLEAGGIATRGRTSTGFTAPGVDLGDLTNSSSVYSIYAGPSVSTRVGPLTAAGSYRFGYTRVDNDTPSILSGYSGLGGYNDSTNHSLSASLGMQPGQLPFGWSVSGGYDREDVDQLDQRYESKYARVDLTYPVSRTLALVGGVGYEDIEISQRTPLLDADNKPVIDNKGNYVTDPNSSRQLAFNTDGLIWDVGVMWRPGPRTALSARVGERYGDTFYSGSLSYRVNRDTNVQIGVYTGLTSFGRQMTNGLAGLPTQFLLVQNPFDGSFGNCGIGQTGASCLNPALAGINSTNYRNRGVLFSVSSRADRWNIGFAAGFDQREYISPLLLGPAGLDGTTDENYYMSVMASRPLDAYSNFSTSLYGSLYDSGFPGVGNAVSVGATAAYDRILWRRLTGQAAVNLNSTHQDGFNSEVIAAILLGLRYGF